MGFVRARLDGGAAGPPAARARGSASGVDGVLGRFTLRHIDEELLVQAGAYREPTLRSLDAIHLATAQSFADAAGAELEALITYDMRLAQAAAGEGIRCIAPS